jgi:hypothetical protein
LVEDILVEDILFKDICIGRGHFDGGNFDW